MMNVEACAEGHQTASGLAGTPSHNLRGLGLKVLSSGVWKGTEFENNRELRQQFLFKGVLSETRQLPGHHPLT